MYIMIQVDQSCLGTGTQSLLQLYYLTHGLKKATCAQICFPRNTGFFWKEDKKPGISAPPVPFTNLPIKPGFLQSVLVIKSC